MYYMLFIFHKKVGRFFNFLMNLELQNIWDQIIWYIWFDTNVLEIVKPRKFMLNFNVM